MPFDGQIQQNTFSRCRNVAIVRIYTYGFYSAWLERVLRRARTATLSSNIQLSSTISIKPRHAPEVARFVNPRFVTPELVLFLEPGPGRCDSNMREFPFGFQYRQGCQTPSMLCPTSDAVELLLHMSGPKRIELCSVYACGHCIDGRTSSQLLVAGRMQFKYNLP
jgi:hypothetical protein